MSIVHKLVLAALGMGLFGGFGIGVIFTDVVRSKQINKNT